LSTAAAIAVGLIVVYSLGEPYAATLRLDGRTMSVAPRQVTSEVRAAVGDLERELESHEIAEELADLQITDYTQQFASRLDRSVTGGRHALDVILEQAGVDEGDVVPVDSNELLGVYTVVAPGAVRNIIVDSGHGVLDENIVPATLYDILDIIGDAHPRDFQYVTVAGTIDLAAWSEALNAVAMGQRLPANWIRSCLFVVDVVLERQKLDPRTGQWGDTEIIPPLPGQLSFRGIEISSHADGDTAVRAIRNSQTEIVQPEFLALSAGPAWHAPGKQDVSLSAEGHARLVRLTEDIERLTRQIEKWERAQERQTPEPRRSTTTRPARRPTSRTSSGFGLEEGTLPSPGGSPTGGLTPPLPSPSPSRSTTQPGAEPSQIQELRRQLDDKQWERDDLLDAIQFDSNTETSDNNTTVLGGSSLMLPGTALPSIGAALPSRGANVGPPAEDVNSATGGIAEQVTCWCHDISVEPGATYRYRLTARLLNPLFQRRQRLTQPQWEEAEKLSIASQPSAWGEPITVDPKCVFFVVGASMEQQAAEIEVYRLYNGIWRSYSFVNVRAGDLVGAERVTRIDELDVPVDFTVGLALVDLVKMEAGYASDTLALLTDVDSNSIIQRSVNADMSNADRDAKRNDAILQQLFESRDTRRPRRPRPGESSPMPFGEGELPGSGGFFAPGEIPAGFEQ